MRFELSPIQRTWQERAAAVTLPPDQKPAETIAAASAAQLLQAPPDLLALTVAVEALALSSPAGALTVALHATTLWSLRQVPEAAGLMGAGAIGAYALETAEVPRLDGSHLTGQAAWVAPATAEGVALVTARAESSHLICAFGLGSAGVQRVAVRQSGLRALACSDLRLQGVDVVVIGSPAPVVARVRLLMAAVCLGVAARALETALSAVRARGGTDVASVSGPLADAATEMEAARLLTWTVATAETDLSVGAASAAKLAAGAAAAAAVARVADVVGVDGLRSGHACETLTQDVRALAALGGGSETLRAAVAEEMSEQHGTREGLWSQSLSPR